MTADYNDTMRRALTLLRELRGTLERLHAEAGTLERGPACYALGHVIEAESALQRIEWQLVTDNIINDHATTQEQER